MNIEAAFPSKYLKASDLNGRNVVVSISGARIEGIGQSKDQKLVLSFYGKEKTFVCNKTNASTIAKLYGPDTDAWVGKPVTLTAREVEFQGEMVLSIRVSLQAPAPTGQFASPQPAAASMPPQVRRNQPVDEMEAANLSVGSSAGDTDVPFASVPDILI